MTPDPNDANSDDPLADPSSEIEADEVASTMSVDQLTQAFAQLMGDDAQETAPVQQVAEAVSLPLDDPANVADSAELDAEDDTSVTPASILEALLFVGHPENEPLTSRQLASLLRGVSPQEVDQLVDELNQQYADQHTAFHIVSVGAGYRMSLRDEFMRLRESFYGRVREAKLSQTAVDLLAIVAYHQPISRDEIDRLRGQPSGGTLSQLVRRQLLSVEYSESKPRKKLFRTTDRFLKLFGLDSLEDLPSHEDF